MKEKYLPNGNLLVPSVKFIDGLQIVTIKEVAPDTEKYLEWAPRP